MCGIAGIIEKNHKPVSAGQLQAMAKLLAMRGPDDEGIWQKGSVGLVHRRLSIVDLSTLGKQPMFSADGRFIITFNGEIYNYLELRRTLEDAGIVFRSHSDTEVLLHLYAKHGVSMLNDLRGMFAFSIWDQEKRELFFARDHLGQKPFFYRRDQNRFCFASDIRALKTHADTVDWDAVRLFFSLQYVPAPKTGFSEIYCLPRGMYGLYSDKGLHLHEYSELSYKMDQRITFQDAVSEVRDLLNQSVAYRLIADVPVGLFLSGGMDSAMIAYLAKDKLKAPFHTFTMGFASADFDERNAAEKIARDIGSEHHSFEARPEDLLAIADSVITEYAAPFADSSSLPVYLLARETAPFVKTVMTGDGGDELFSGYRRYQYFRMGASLKSKHVLFGARVVAMFLASLRHDPRYARFADMLGGLRHSYARGYARLFAGSYFHELALRDLLQPDFFQSTQPSNGEEYIIEHFPEGLQSRGALAFDLLSYLPDDLNVKMDRATMAHGLEARSPFQDHALVHKLLSLPDDVLLPDKGQKPLLREAMRGLVPDEIFSRPKMGFQVPLAEWFRGPLRASFEERCLSSGLKLQHIVKTERIQYYLRKNDAGEDHGNRLWMLYSLSTWLNQL